MNLLDSLITLKDGTSVQWHKPIDFTFDIKTSVISVRVKSWKVYEHAIYDYPPDIECVIDVHVDKWDESYSSNLLQFISEENRLLITLTRPTRPSVFYEWNWQTNQWEDTRNLVDLKSAQWTAIKQSRSQAEASGFNWGGSTFDSDAESQARINGAVTLALIAKQANQPYSITWTLKDNTLRVLSADDMVAVGLALGTHVQTVFNKGQQLQQQIEQATTKEELEAITWQI